MKTSTSLLAALALGATVCAGFAQEQDAPRRRPGAPPPGEGRPDSPPPGEFRGGPGGERPRPPLIAALDANNDGVIDEKELANATAALKALDKNSDGKLTMDELMPQRPGGPRGPGGPGSPEGRRPGGPDGERPERPQRPQGEL